MCIKGKILLLFVTMILISTTALAATETRLVTGQRLVQDTEVGNHLVTWYETSANGVHIYDLNTKRTYDNIAYNGGESGPMEVYNNYAAWSDMDEGVYLFDSGTGTVTQVDASGYSPVLYGSKLVYTKNSNIVVYDITAKSRYQFPSQDMETDDLYGNKVVGVKYDSTNSGSSVWIADISTKQMSAISTTGHASDPQIYGNIVVWAEADNTKSNVFMRDINAHVTSQVTTDGSSFYPKIYGSRIVYTKGNAYVRDGVNNIYMYDKSTGKTTQITNSGTAACPSIYENNIIYEDFKYADTEMREEGDLYLYNLATAPVAAFTASKTYSSTHPVTITFTYTGTGTTPITCKWNFGDGKSASTTSKSISHTYVGAGVYTVGLTVANSAGNNYLSKSRFITVK